MTTTKRRPEVVTNQTEIRAIAARVAYGKLPPLQRLVTRRPAGWGTGRWGF